MTIDSSSSGGAASSIGHVGAAKIRTWQRWMLFLLAALSFAGGVFLVAGKKPPELVVTTLFVMGSITLMLAILGRLPRSFEVAGFTLDYEQNQMAEFLATLRGSGLDEETLDELERTLGEMSGDRREFRLAQREAGESAVDDERVEGSQASALSSGDAPQTNRGESVLATVLREIADRDDVQKQFDIAQGRGRPARVDFYFETGGKSVAVEVLTAWNPTTLRLLAARLHKVLGADDGVEIGLVVAPGAGVERLRKMLQEESLSRRVAVVADSDVSAERLRGLLASL